jgi:phosphatidylserine/phosphatidylglycerophosphate/cardiolipin synthase-like enzyme
MNCDNRSMALNDEATLMVLDATIGKQMDHIFLDDLASAEEVTIAAFRQRLWFQRLGEWGANLLHAHAVKSYGGYAVEDPEARNAHGRESRGLHGAASPTYTASIRRTITNVIC